MHRAAERASAEDGSKPAEQPGKVNREAGEQSKEEQEGDHPMQETGVNAMAKQFALIDVILAELVEGMVGFLVEALNRGSHRGPPSRVAPVAGGAGLPSRSAGKLPAIRIGQKSPARAWRAISTRCSSRGFGDP